MPDSKILEAIQDSDSFRTYVEARLTEAMRGAIRQINQKEDARIIELLRRTRCQPIA